MKIVQLILSIFFFVLGLILPENLNFICYLFSYFIIGFEILYKSIRNIFHKEFFDENFLMSIATIGAFLLGEYAEAIAVMLFYQIGEFLSDLAVDRSKDSIISLLDLKPEIAHKKDNNQWITISPNNVEMGDIISVFPGEKIPLDGKVISGNGSLDTSSLTGETKRKKVEIGMEVLSGMVNQSGILEVEVTKSFQNSTATRILKLVEDTESKKAPTEKFITKFSKYYTPIVVFFAFLLTIIPVLMGESFATWFHRSLVFLVISCPCALVISIPLSFFAGIGACSKNGILVKGGNYLEALNDVDTFFFDKTGTLTEGVFEVISEKVVNGSLENFLEYAYLLEQYSSHPIAKSILNRCGKIKSNKKITSLEEVAGFGVRAMIDGKTAMIGKKAFLENENIKVDEKPSEIGTVVYLAINQNYIGYFLISDVLRKTSKETISYLKSKNLETILLTGDCMETAQYYQKELGIDICYGELLPEEKLEKIEEYQKNKTVLFMGDGINDAPALMKANVGVSFGNLGSDAAIEASDIVFMYDDASSLIKVMDIAKFTKKIVLENISFALLIKIVILLLGSIGIASMWFAVFADVGVTFLTVLNSLRIMKKCK